ncbi:hypothetical protein HYE66_04030 [Aggregatibacter actinomycetemcomitans]|nr:hypothetical protein [Aggregatibacter actinomycetemcomitans]
MKLTKEQETYLLNSYKKAKEENKFVEISVDEIKQRRAEKRAEFVKNKKVIDEVFYSEVVYP